MALCVTSMINLNVLVIHLLQHLCQSYTVWNHHQHPELTYLYTKVSLIDSSSNCAVNIYINSVHWHTFSIYFFFLTSIFVISKVDGQPGTPLLGTELWFLIFCYTRVHFAQSIKVLSHTVRVLWLTRVALGRLIRALFVGLWLWQKYKL